MADTVEPSERRAFRSALLQLEQQLSELSQNRFSYTDLEKVQIIALQMRFDESGYPDLGPRFFEPFPAHLLPSPDDLEDKEFPEHGRQTQSSRFKVRPIDCARQVDQYLGQYESMCTMRLENTDHSVPWHYIDYDKYKFKPLEEIYLPPDNPNPSWNATGVGHVPGHEYPHMNCTMIHNVDGKDGELLRGELLTLIRIMFRRLTTKSLVEHMLAPVLLFSFMGPQHARILQGHFDGKNLTVHYTKLYDFRRKDNETIKLFARWLLCHPTGETRCIAS